MDSVNISPTKKIAGTALLILASSISHADTPGTDGNEIRLDFAIASSSIAMINGGDEVSTLSSEYTSHFTYQFASGGFGELALQKSNLNEISINNRIFDADESASGKLIGFGYRLNRNSDTGEYWGFGYRASWDDDAEFDSTGTIRTFWEKNNTQRYGMIDLSYSSSDNSDLLSVSGKHLWFPKRSFGYGLNWGVGSGTMGNTTSFGAASIGAGLMWRPSL